MPFETRYAELSEAELRTEARRMEYELERRRLHALAPLPADSVMAEPDDLAFLDHEWADAYMGSLSENDDAKEALRWLWAGTVIAHESQYDRPPSVGHVVRSINEALAGLLLGGGGEDTTDMRDTDEQPGFGGRGCACSLYDDGGPESGPRLGVEISEQCWLHKHLLADEPADWPEPATDLARPLDHGPTQAEFEAAEAEATERQRAEWEG